MAQLCEVRPKVPDAELASRIATCVVGSAPISVSRFTTGTAHYAFDVAFAEQPPIVVRIGGASARTSMTGALHLSGLLRPRGVPLPAILADDVKAEFPWMVMERLPGTDLGDVITRLSREQLGQIAVEVARAQAITAQTGSAGLFGYASCSVQAPHGAWSCVLEESLSRSQERIASAGLFDASLVEVIRGKLDAMREQVEQIEPTPFLHDTTTKNVIIAPDGKFSGIIGRR